MRPRGQDDISPHIAVFTHLFIKKMILLKAHGLLLQPEWFEHKRASLMISDLFCSLQILTQTILRHLGIQRRKMCVSCKEIQR